MIRFLPVIAISFCPILLRLPVSRLGRLRSSFLSQSGERPERYIEASRFDTMPSSPILQAWAKAVGPSPSICSLNRIRGTGRALAPSAGGAAFVKAAVTSSRRADDAQRHRPDCSARVWELNHVD